MGHVSLFLWHALSCYYFEMWAFDYTTTSPSVYGLASCRPLPIRPARGSRTSEISYKDVFSLACAVFLVVSNCLSSLSLSFQTPISSCCPWHVGVELQLWSATVILFSTDSQQGCQFHQCSESDETDPPAQPECWALNYFVSILREDPWWGRFPPSCAALSHIGGEVWMDMENASSFCTPFVGISLALGWSGCCSFSNGFQSSCKGILLGILLNWCLWRKGRVWTFLLYHLANITPLVSAVSKQVLSVLWVRQDRNQSLE